MDKGVPFICTDLGLSVAPFMLHIHASVAEHERKLIGERTKAGIAEKIKRGGSHGFPQSLDKAREKAIITKNTDALDFARCVYPQIASLKHTGHSLQAISRQLNQSNTPTSANGLWTAKAVSRVIERVEASKSSDLEASQELAAESLLKPLLSSAARAPTTNRNTQKKAA
jgi:hypothetical protein